LLPYDENEYNYYDYLFMIDKVDNPDNGLFRTDESYELDLDLTPEDPLDNLWVFYEEFSYRLNLAIFDVATFETDDDDYYNVMSHDSLHSNWLGFQAGLKLLEVKDYYDE